MKVRVRLFASYREAVGVPSVELALDGVGGGQAVWAALVAQYPALARLPAPSGYAVNDEYVDGLRPLRDDDEVALIPPVSGGDDPGESHAASPRSATIDITGEPLSIDRAVRAVADPGAGAIVVFLGVVRDNARGRRVTRLEYEAYDVLARREMEKIAATIGSRWPMIRVAILHRIGHLKVGEASVVIAASAPHRAEAFDAARYAIDTLKLTVPIWKKEIWESGEAWIGVEA